MTNALEALEREAGFSRDAEITCALIDWPVMNNVCRLLEAPDSIQDPFVALQDLATVIAALVFYDRLLVIDWPLIGAVHEPIDRRAARLLGLDNEIAGLDSKGALTQVLSWPTLREDLHIHTRQSVLRALFWATVLDFDNATRAQAPWLRLLEARWRDLLPSTPWTPHTVAECWDAFGPLDTAHLNVPHYDGLFTSSSPQLESRLAILDHKRYEQVDSEAARVIVLDNNVRAVFHAAVASGLHDALVGESADVRYVAGCLRAPVQMVLAQLAKASLTDSHSPAIESWLDLVWSGQQHQATTPVSMPFWFDAVFRGIDNPKDLPERINTFRTLAKRFRARRRELEHQVAVGNHKVSSHLASALTADAAALTKRTKESVGAAVAVSDVALKLAAPTPLGIAQVGKAVGGAVGSDWVTKLTVRTFHPELRAIHSLGRDAALLSNSLPSALALFGFAPADAGAPLSFVRRLRAPVVVN